MKKIIAIAFDIPKSKASFRVKIWRELQKIGAEQRLGSHWILPLSGVNLRYIRKIAKEITSAGGNAEIIVGEKVV
jgi:hypothetical protein